jgi:hypothetical protein
VGQGEHAVVEGVEAGQGHKLREGKEGRDNIADRLEKCLNWTSCFVAVTQNAGATGRTGMRLSGVAAYEVLEVPAYVPWKV